MIEKIYIDEGVRKMKLKTGHLEDMIMVADKINEVIEDYNKRVGSDGI